MPPHLAPGLSPEEASHLCMTQCRGMCCRGGLILVLQASEVDPFARRATELGVDAGVERRPGGTGWVRFSEQPGERCPMLDDATSSCRIYEHRPQRCRNFPETLVTGCIISGG